MFNFGFDPEKYASLGSSFDEPDPFAPTPVAPAPKNLPVAPEIVKAPVSSVTPKQERVIAKGPVATNKLSDRANEEHGIVKAPVAPAAVVKPTPVVSRSSNTFSGLPSNEDISFSSGDVYETPDKALGGFASFIGNLESQRRDTNKKYGLTRFDPMDYVREGLSGPRDLGNTAARDALTSYVKDNNMPLTQVRDGVTYHLTGGSETFNNILHGRVRDGVWQDQGPVGTYSTVYIDTSQSMFQEVLNNPAIRIGAALATGGASEAYISAGKGLAGETLHASDWLSIATVGLEAADVLKAPASAEEARKIGELAAQSGNVASGMAATEIAKAGKGFTILGNELSYAASKSLLTAASTGNVKSALLSVVGDKVVTGALDAVGLDKATIEGKGIGYNDFTAGVNKVVKEVSDGRDIDDALALGLAKYIKEGGTFGAGTTDTLTEVVRNIVRPLGTAATDLYRLVEGAIPDLPEGSLPDLSGIGDALSAADTAVRKGLREFDKTIQPVTKEIGKGLSAAETLARKGLSEFDDAIINPTGKFLSAADTAARKALTQLDEGLYDIQSPFSTPQFNSPELPDINLPSFNLDFGFNSGSGMLSGVTTGKIFGDELFEFKNKIKLTEYGPMFQEQEVDIEDFLTSPFESAFTTSQRFA